jgi:DNA repair photolyase
MQQEDQWINEVLGIDEPEDTGTGIANETKAAYAYFMRPEPKDGMGPIEEELDPFTSRVMRWRYIDVGMVRNAKAEDKQQRKVYLDPLPHIRLEQGKPLQGWYQSAHAAGEVSRSRPRPCFTEATLTEPYGGYCTVGCSFCYVNSGMRGYRGSGLVSVPLHYGEHVARQLKSCSTAAAGYFSSFTDPFLPLEDYYHNTQQAAEAFTREGLPVFFLSRILYPGWAIDILKQNRYSYAQKSLNTGVDADFKRMSPGAASLEDHIQQVGDLRRRGIYTSIQVNPIIAGVTSHEDIRTLFERLAAVGNNHVIVKFVEAGFSWAPAMVERITKRFGPERGGRFAELFTDNIGGQKTVLEEYRMESHPLYQRWATELGMTYATCYEFAYERDEMGEVVSKLGVSIGGRFKTSDQCHGHRVPVFTRITPNAPFKEVAECPPSGCLTCASDNAGVARCGNEEMGKAKAIRLVDMRKSVYGSLLA